VAVTSTGTGNASGITIYIDGVPGTSTKVIDLNALNGTITNSQTVNLGARQGAYLFNGTLDEVAIYPTALTAAQLAAHVSARTQTSSTITSIDTFDGAYRNAVIDDKASGYWRLGEPALQAGVTDQRSAHPGSYRSGVTVGVAGALTGDTDTAATFDGTTKAVAPVADYTIFGNTAATIEAWFKTTASGPIFGYQSGSVDVTPTGWVPALYVGTDGKLRGTLWPTPVITSTATVNNGAWHHAVLTHNGSTATLYLDGVTVGSSSGGISWLAMGQNQIGAAYSASWPSTNGGWWGFNGTIDEVAVYPTALSSAKVSDHYSVRSQPASSATTKHRIRIDYQELTGTAALTVTGPTNTALSPRYDLVTQTVDPDGQTSATEYTSPWLGQATASVVDPAGLNLRTTTGYEPAGASSYLRRTSRTLPAGGQATYDYYSQGSNPTNATDPCGTITGPIPQGGALWKTTDAAGKVVEVVHNAQGQAIATRVGTEPWTCTSFDARGRPAQTAYPALFGQPARTVHYDYAVGNNPAVTAVCDNNVAGSPVSVSAGTCNGSNGVVTTTVDWTGRTVTYTDVWGKTTTTAYDQAGRTSSTSTAGAPAGATAFTYDASGRLATQTLGGNLIAQPTYDAPSGAMTAVSYPSGAGTAGNGTSGTFTSDSRGRPATISWTGPSATPITSDEVTARTTAGQILDGKTDGTDPNASGNNYTYDAAGRLTDAWAPGHHYTYGFGTTTGCTANNAGKNTNRTSMSDNGTTTSYCYNTADRIESVAPAGPYGGFTYDTHGNTTVLGAETHGYDAADRHMTTSGGGVDVTYQRDATDRIVSRTASQPGTIIPRGTPTSATTGGAATSLALTRPTTAQDGDLLIAQVTVGGGTGVAVTAPTGWTLVAGTPVNQSTSVQNALYTHIKASTDPASWTWTLSTSKHAAGGIAAYGGVDPTSPVDVAATNTQVATTSVVAPSVTTTSANDELFVAYALTTDAAVSTPTPSGLTAVWTKASTGNPAGNRVRSASFDKTLSTPGATGTYTAATSPSTSVSAASVTVALRPARITTVVRYAYTGSGDSADLTLDGTGAIVEQTVGLPGGTSLTRRVGSSDVWSHPNLHGDIAATTGPTGAKIGATFTYDPYGNPLGALPDNSAAAMDYAWLGQHQRPLEHQAGLLPMIEMGARQYDPHLGRFLETDPIEGGCSNAYSYVVDPINTSDLDGTKCRGVFGAVVAFFSAGDYFRAAQRAARGDLTGGLAILGVALSKDYVSGRARTAVLRKTGKSLGARAFRVAVRVLAWPATVAATAADAICSSEKTGGGRSLTGTRSSGQPGGFYNPGVPG
jgi:RHS repeat-associated protein